MSENEKPIPDPRKLSWILYPWICHIVNLVGLEPATFQMCFLSEDQMTNEGFLIYS